MGPLVCCVDDSEGARGALMVARRLAETLGLELVLVNVQPPTEAPGVSAAPAGQERLHDEEVRDAERFLTRVAGEEGLDEADVRRRVVTGSAGARILAVCEEERAELVVVGSRGRGGLKRTLLGSVSQEVATKAACPCVIVPPQAGQQPFLA
jgi:nucleotide-binding universal stress UspA family protein